MKRATGLLIASLFIIAAACGAELPTAKPEDAGMSSEKLAAVKTIIQKAVDEKQTAGVVVLVARHGKIVQLESVGKMDIKADKPMRPDSIFRIFSMSKPITTVAAMMLVEEDKLKLDEPIATYLPELKGLRVYGGKEGATAPAKREPTIRDLMRHTAGMTYGVPAFVPGSSPVDAMYIAAKVQDRDGTLADMVKKLGKIPLFDQPGTRFNYSIATDVLGRVVEVVSGKSLDAFMQERIFTPLDMRDTGFKVPADKLERFTASYRSGGGSLNVDDDPATSLFRAQPTFLSGGGGLVSTARDYARFSQMLLNSGELDGVRLLKPETIAEMTKNQMPADALPITIMGFPIPGHGFGLGLMVRMDPQASIGDGTYSWAGLASTFFWVSPKPQTVVIILQQLQPTSPALQQALTPVIFDAIKN